MDSQVAMQHKACTIRPVNKENENTLTTGLPTCYSGITYDLSVNEISFIFNVAMTTVNKSTFKKSEMFHYVRCIFEILSTYFFIYFLFMFYITFVVTVSL